jgi:hypothetical protein
MQPSQRNGCNIQVSRFQNHSWAVYFHIYTSFVNIVCILTWECNLFFLFSYVRFQGTTKEAFVTNAI